MSNWLRAKISTTIKNPRRDVFAKALDNMGFKPDYSRKAVYGSFSSEASEPVNCVLLYKDTGKPSTIGFNFSRGKDGDVSLSVTGDFWGLSYNGDEFMKRLGLQYNCEYTKAVMEERGFTIEETTQENDQIVLIGYRQVA